VIKPHFSAHFGGLAEYFTRPACG